MEITDQDDLFVPLPDGTRLAARLWRPANPAPVPAILEYIPYRKRDNTLPRDETIHPWMAAQGYACLRVDIRGTGDSEGTIDDEYSPRELADARDVIAWIAAQDWCSGAVGMMGKSWGAFNALQTAALHPPALKAVVKVCGSVDRFADDIHFKGGCLLGENFAWGTLMLSYCARPADPLLRPDWREDFRARIASMPHLSEIWSRHQTRDAYWKHGSVCEDYAALGCPVLTVGGWNDNYMNAPAALVQDAPMAKAIVGPWVHQYPHTAVPAPRIDFLAEMKAWWDHWLKGLDTGVEAWPDYRVYQLDSAPPDASAAHRPGRWLAESLPSPGVTEHRLSLGANGVLGGAGSPEAALATAQTLGAAAGEFFPMGLNAEMSGDQRADDALSLCFDQPCPDGLSLLGAARLDLRLTPGGTHGHLIARLNDVAPDGSSVRIAHGMINLRHHCTPPQPLTPGQPIAITLALDQMAFRLAHGHRLRLALSTTYWPFLWPAPEAAPLYLHAGTLTLPVHSGAAPGWDFAAPAPVAPSRLRTLSKGHETRTRCIDAITRVERITVHSDSGETENPDHGLRTRAVMTEDWSIHPDDPLSAACTITWQQSFARGEWSVTTDLRATQSCDRDFLHLDATLRCTITDGGTALTRHRPAAPETIERNFIARVARDHV